MNVLQWLNDAGWGNAVAVVALVVAVWQVARTEGMQPPEAVEVQVQRRTITTCIVHVSSYAGYQLHAATLTPIDGCRKVPGDNEWEPCADIGSSGHEVCLNVTMTGDGKQRVLLEWVEPTMIRRLPFAHAQRITFDLHYHPIDVTIERWQWNMFAPLARLANRSICRRKPLCLGHWVHQEASWWKSSLPENAGSMPGRGTRTGRRPHRSTSASAGGASRVVRR